MGAWVGLTKGQKPASVLRRRPGSSRATGRGRVGDCEHRIVCRSGNGRSPAWSLGVSCNRLLACCKPKPPNFRKERGTLNALATSPWPYEGHVPSYCSLQLRDSHSWSQGIQDSQGVGSHKHAERLAPGPLAPPPRTKLRASSSLAALWLDRLRRWMRPSSSSWTNTWHSNK